MVIDLRAVFSGDTSRLPLNEAIDLSAEEIDGGQPFKEPVMLTGEIKNSADVVKLDAVIKAAVTKPCDRCLANTRKVYEIELKRVLLTDAQPDSDECLPVPQYQLDLDELCRSEIVLNLPTLHLCSEDCRGICPVCGQNLNERDCDCPK